MREIFVSETGDDRAAGSIRSPLRTIQRAAELAQPGDTITVRAGTYRERVDPPWGGDSAERRITFRAAPGERVVITGSEHLKGWKPAGGGVWTAAIPDAFFGSFNPFAAPLRGHWYRERGHPVHPGSVFLRGHWLAEAADKKSVYEAGGPELLWFAERADGATVLHARFGDADPNADDVEITVRQCVFYPSRPGVNFLTVRGFVMRNAATPWAPPTTEQIGLIGANWGRGWVIEDNDIAYSACAGLTLGKYHDPEDHGDRPVIEYTGEDTYHGTIRRALERGWSREATGGHVVRRNRIAHCEMAGICGSLGAIFSEITENEIHDIHVRRAFDGWEMAGIKFHGAIDTLIARNHVYRCIRGLWLDWMSQGTRVRANVFHDNGPGADLYLEVNHGPCVVDHNLFLSPFALYDRSEGSLLAHNLFAGTIKVEPEPGRITPCHAPHATTVTGWHSIRGGDNRILNNLLYPPASLDVYAAPQLSPSLVEGNFTVESPDATRPPRAKVEATDGGLRLRFDPPPTEGRCLRIVSGADLGETVVSEAAFTDYDGKPLRLERDFFDHPHENPPRPGPFEERMNGVIQLWE